MVTSAPLLICASKSSLKSKLMAIFASVIMTYFCGCFNRYPRRLSSASMRPSNTFTCFCANGGTIFRPPFCGPDPTHGRRRDDPAGNGNFSYDNGNIVNSAVYHAGKNKITHAVSAGKWNGCHEALRNQIRHHCIIAVREIIPNASVFEFNIAPHPPSHLHKS